MCSSGWGPGLHKFYYIELDGIQIVSRGHTKKSLGPVLILASFHIVSLIRVSCTSFIFSVLPTTSPPFTQWSATICQHVARTTSSYNASSVLEFISPSDTRLSSFPWSHSGSLLSFLTEHFLGALVPTCYVNICICLYMHIYTLVRQIYA